MPAGYSIAIRFTQAEERRWKCEYSGAQECSSRRWASAAAQSAGSWCAAIHSTRSAPSRATAAGVNYFDTAVQYGNGESEKNLGRVLQKLKPPAVVGTKVRLPSGDFARITDAVAKSLESSLTRLHLDHVDIFHLHN